MFLKFFAHPQKKLTHLSKIHRVFYFANRFVVSILQHKKFISVVLHEIRLLYYMSICEYRRGVYLCREIKLINNPNSLQRLYTHEFYGFMEIFVPNWMWQKSVISFEWKYCRNLKKICIQALPVELKRTKSP